MKLNATQSWVVPTENVEVDHPKLGRVRVTHWSQQHFQKSSKRPLEILRVEVLETPVGKHTLSPLLLRPNLAVNSPVALKGNILLPVLSIQQSKNEPRNAKNPSNLGAILSQRQLRLEPVCGLMHVVQPE